MPVPKGCSCPKDAHAALGHPTVPPRTPGSDLQRGGDARPTARLAPRRGFSYVDLVEGLRDGRFYALKRILCHDKEDRRAALHEAEMHGLFEHPNILRLEAHCLVEKGAKHEAWLLLPYVQRDLKPTNVLLDEDDRAVLMDLGSMNQARIEVNSSREAMAVQDWAAQRCTISYRAPELFTVQSQCVIDERTDIWDALVEVWTESLTAGGASCRGGGEQGALSGLSNRPCPAAKRCRRGRAAEDGPCGSLQPERSQGELGLRPKGA
nr:PREDICTED: serine/threonine-protein kinase 16 [Apteryx mantelli mantelli]